MKPFTHVISIRHSYPNGVPEDRARYFELCMDSLRNQTEKYFRVHVIEDRIDKSVAKEMATVTTPWVIHTRLDNDDLLHPDFVRRVQSRFRHQPMIIDTKGYRYNQESEEVVRFDWYSNIRTSPFISLVQRTEDIHQGVYEYKHNDMPKHFPVEIIPEYLWMQRIHESNKLMKWFTGFPTVMKESWVR